MPFFDYKGKMFCYLWTLKDAGTPYLGLVNGNRLDHPDLLQQGRKRMKVLLLDPAADLPLQKINHILKAAMDVH